MKYCFLSLVFTCLSLSFAASAQSDSTNYNEQYLKNLLSTAILFDTTRVEHREEATFRADSMQEWKKWRTVDNYFYGKNRGSLPMIADLNALHPYFRDRIVDLIDKCEAAGIQLAIVESYRTHSKQAEYYAMGRKYTSKSGGKSRHQYGLAVDVVPIVDSVAVWNNHRLWRKIGSIGERLGLTWGGRWRVLYDPGHFEWSGGLTRDQLANGRLPKVPGLASEDYIFLQDELTKLQNYWEAWEVEQSMIANSSAPRADVDDEMVGAGN